MVVRKLTSVPAGFGQASAQFHSTQRVVVDQSLCLRLYPRVCLSCKRSFRAADSSVIPNLPDRSKAKSGSVLPCLFVRQSAGIFKWSTQRIRPFLSALRVALAHPTPFADLRHHPSHSQEDRWATSRLPSPKLLLVALLCLLNMPCTQISLRICATLRSGSLGSPFHGTWRSSTKDLLFPLPMTVFQLPAYYWQCGRAFRSSNVADCKWLVSPPTDPCRRR